MPLDAAPVTGEEDAQGLVLTWPGMIWIPEITGVGDEPPMIEFKVVNIDEVNYGWAGSALLWPIEDIAQVPVPLQRLSGGVGPAFWPSTNAP